jgi:hypothetical protein
VTNGDWPAPEPHEERPRLPLPRVDDLPVAEQGYDREAVREAFDAFYRHAAQLDATLRTLEAVDVFQRTASELRAEMRTIRAGGWTVSSYGRGGYGGGRGGAGVREWSLPPAFPRIAAEALFLIVIGIVVGVAGWSRIAIVLVMGLALAIVWLVEFVASRERAVPRTVVAPPQPPRLDEEPAELPAGEAEVAEQAEEGPEAITILGTAEPSRAEEDEPADTQGDEEQEQEPEPVVEPQAEVVAAAEPEPEPEPARAEADEEPEPEPEPEPPPEVQVSATSPIVSPGGAPPMPAPVPPVSDEPEPKAAEAEPTAAAVDAGDELDEGPEAERADELVAQSHKVDPAPETAHAESLEAPAEPPETREEELVAQSHKLGPAPADEAAVDEPESEADVAAELEAAPIDDEDTRDEETPDDEALDEDTLSGIEAVRAVPTEPEPARRRFRLFRRREEEAAEPEPTLEPTPEPTPEPEAVVDPWVLPTSERPADEYGAPAEAEAVDPWEQGPDLHAVAEPAVEEDDTPPPTPRGWFSRRQDAPQEEEAVHAELEPEPLELIVEPETEPQPDPELEPEPVELLVEADQEPEPAPPELPVEALAEQAAAAIDRSRVRRRAPRRARRR